MEEIRQMENQIKLFTIQDIYDENDKQIPVDITKKYDPLYFWDDYGDKYYRSFKRVQDLQKYVPWLLSRIASLNIKNLLDAGCGFGRLEPFLIDGGAVEEITGIDISQKQLDCAKEYLKEYQKSDKIKFIKASVKNLPFKDSSFDCVLSVECLTHMHLPSVRYAIKHMERVTRRYIVMVERFVFDGEHPQPHIWTHNYPKLWSDNGLKILECKLIGAGVIGMVLKK